MPIDASISGSTSASSGNKISTGPTTFGGIAFGPQTAARTGPSTAELVIGLAALGLVAFVLLKKGAL